MSLDDLQAQLRGTLDQQFAALNQKYQDGLAEARRQAAADAERELAIRLDAVRAEFSSRLEANVAGVRAEAQQQAALAIDHERAEYAQLIERLSVEQAQAIERERAEYAQVLERLNAEHAQAIEHERVEYAQAIERARAEQAQAAEHAAGQAAEAARTDAARQASETLDRLRADHAQAAERQRAEFDQALALAVEQAVTQAVAGARRTAALELESERRRAQNEIDAARQQAKAETAAAHQQAQGVSDAGRQQLKAALDGERQQLASALDTERQRARGEIDALRRQMQADSDALRERMQGELAAARQAAAGGQPSAAPAAAAGVPAAAFTRALAAIREIDGAQTLSQALDILLAQAGAVAGRAAIFLINADRLKAWKASGIPAIDVETVESSIGGKDLLARAIQSGQATPSGAGLPAPPFARLPVDRVGLAIPLMIGGRAVAVVYADSGSAAPAPGWAQMVESLVRHTSAVVALRTAMRTLDVLSGDGDPAAGQVSDAQGARRYARLLVSEIKLYNDAAVRAGREQRDLLQRLRPEIDRAQRLYEERVPSEVGGRQVFEQELLQTLADGDPALLGTS